MRVAVVVCLLCVASCLLATMPQSPASSPVSHQGDIVLGGSQRMVIEGVIYEQAGSIHLNGSSTLVIRDSELRFTNTSQSIWGAFGKIVVRDQASLQIEDSTITGSYRGGGLGSMVNINAWDSSRILWEAAVAEGAVLSLFDVSQLDMRGGTVFEMNLEDSPTATIEDSTVIWALGLEFVGNSQATLSGLKPGHVEYLVFPAGTSERGPVPSLEITNSSIGAWSVLAGDTADLTLRDCHINRLNVMLRDPSGSIEGWRPGYFADWNPTRDTSILAPLNLHLLRTTVTSNLCVWFDGGSHDVEVSDSKFANLLLYQYSGTTTFTDCVLDGFWINDSTPNLRFVNSEVRFGLDLMESSVSIAGDVAFSEQALFGTWESSSVFRDYEVRVVDATGRPVPNSRIRVESPTGHIYERTTDDGGLISVLLSFTDATSQLVWELTATTPDGELAMGQLRFLSTSPFVIRLP